MIDPIGVTPGTVQGVRVEPREATKVVSLQSIRASEPAVAETSARETAKALAAQPPVDTDRVQQIRRALQEGRYPLVPAKIADRMIAAQMKWAEKK
ncbi:flagellar biosynthesis anti-sigma factor FlgM [Sphingomonas changbaiensis NBRC 104936]|uniref:Negative regulator of flagellin synthesis n=1 Tax=Sphingomonas changbaiensis NBRC 104936 TaxID=1219043 RepID=A0A0E9MRK9_9SPHN|nr:flagellar biosynthesis anti-sigma factor FlgM [Sphingomonas changbaiensis]GAO39780.1 flagellar biosynthesis anti-sigma factor FlgM [Sphingomonas changbaiensis NBRC 104936]